MVASRTAQQTEVQPLLLTVNEAARQIRIGRTKMYELIASGEVKSVCVGRHRRIAYSELVSYTERLAAS